METAIENLVAEKKPNIQRLAVPEVHEWIKEEVAQSYSYEKSWDEAKLDPWIIFHTSGTTGTIETPSSELKMCRNFNGL